MGNNSSPRIAAKPGAPDERGVAFDRERTEPVAHAVRYSILRGAKEEACCQNTGALISTASCPPRLLP